MTNDDMVAGRSKAPDFEHWDGPETHVRWERGLAIVAGMIAVVLTFFLVIAVLPLSPTDESGPITGLQPTAEPEPTQAPAGAAAVAPASAPTAAAAGATPAAQAAPTRTPQPAPPADQRLTAVSRAFPNVRRGPGLDAAIVTNLRQGQRVEVVSRSMDNLWLQILHPENSRERVWVSADMLEVTGDVRTLPQVRPD